MPSGRSTRTETSSMRARRCTRETRLVLPITSRSPLAMRRSRRNSGSSSSGVGRAKRDVAVVAQDAEPRAGLDLHGSAPTAPPSTLVRAGAQQDEVPVAQPVEERGGLLDLVGIAHRRRGVHGSGHALDHRQHRREVAHGELQLGQRLAHRRDQRLALLAASSWPLELQPHRPTRARSPRAHPRRATMRPSASRSMPTIGCSSRRTRCPAPCTAARTVSTRNGASGTLSSSAVPAGGESIMRTAIGCRPRASAKS